MTMVWAELPCSSSAVGQWELRDYVPSNYFFACISLPTPPSTIISCFSLYHVPQLVCIRGSFMGHWGRPHCESNCLIKTQGNAQRSQCKGRHTHEVCNVNRAAEMETERRSAYVRLWTALAFTLEEMGSHWKDLNRGETWSGCNRIVLGSLAGYSP